MSRLGMKKLDMRRLVMRSLHRRKPRLDDELLGNRQHHRQHTSRAIGLAPSWENITRVRW